MFSVWFGLVYLLFNVTINDISVIYVTAHRCAGGLKKKLDLRSGSQRHRHFVGFFNVPVLAPLRDHPFYTVIPTHRPIFFNKFNIDVSSLLMSPLRAIVICQKYFGNHVKSSQIHPFAPLLNMRRCTLGVSEINLISNVISKMQLQSVISTPIWYVHKLCVATPKYDRENTGTCSYHTNIISPFW